MLCWHASNEMKGTRDPVSACRYGIMTSGRFSAREDLGMLILRELHEHMVAKMRERVMPAPISDFSMWRTRRRKYQAGGSNGYGV